MKKLLVILAMFTGTSAFAINYQCDGKSVTSSGMESNVELNLRINMITMLAMGSEPSYSVSLEGRIGFSLPSMTLVNNGKVSVVSPLGYQLRNIDPLNVIIPAISKSQDNTSSVLEVKVEGLSKDGKAFIQMNSTGFPSGSDISIFLNTASGVQQIDCEASVQMMNNL